MLIARFAIGLPARAVWARMAVLGLLVLGLGGCGGSSALDSPDAGRTTAYEPGEPDFDLEAIATIQDGRPGLDLYLSVPHASLVFTQHDGGFRARYRYDVAVRDERGRERVLARTVVDTLRLERFAETKFFRPRVLVERLDVGPGTYVVEALLTDEETDKFAERRQRVEVPVPIGAPSMSRVLLSIKRPQDVFEPQVALNVPSGFDSLRATVEIYDPPVDAVVRLQLDRLRSDTTVARPGFWLGYGRSQLEFKGVDFEGPPADTIQITTRPLGEVGPEVTVEVNLPPLDPGIYRLRMEARPSPDGAPFAEETRDYAVREPDFPRLTEIIDLIDALAYLGTEREVDFMRDAPSVGEQRRRFDAFWGSLFNDRRVAASVIRLYYERVEQANLLFSTHKDGWKTDRGMVFILFGRPEFVETLPNAETWYYNYGLRNAVSTFVFERSSFYDGGTRPAFENWVLQRSGGYEQAWSRMVRRWRDGTVL